MAEDMFEGPKVEDIQFSDMLACVDRELAMRRKVYPRWVGQKKLTQAAADLEILRMRAVRLCIIERHAVQYENSPDDVKKLLARYPEPQP